jgi:hypothetical protein
LRDAIADGLAVADLIGPTGVVRMFDMHVTAGIIAGLVLTTEHNRSLEHLN